MIINRLIQFYRNAAQDNTEVVEGIWASILLTSHAKLLAALKSGDAESLNTILHGNEVLWGLEHQELYKWDELRGMEALNQLGRRIGFVAQPNPEQESPSKNYFNPSPEDLRAKIETVVGELYVPDPFGRPCERGKGAPYMLLHSLAQAVTIKMMLGSFPKHILEIGAGVGYFGFASHRFGSEKYTVIDLPTTAVIGAYALSTLLGEDKIWLFGEDKNDDAFAHFYPSTRFDLARSKYDSRSLLIFNGNSLPEVSTTTQDMYLRLIPFWLNDGGCFYSCNHESDNCNQRSVPMAFRGISTGMNLIYRAPFMMRDGYMEEIYRKI